MTRIIDGFAQPDIVATKGNEKRVIFVETPDSFPCNKEALKKTHRWLIENEPSTILEFIMMKLRGKK